METTALSKRSIAFGLAAAVACVVNAGIVVVKEKSDAVMAGMKKITGHHWTTHSFIIIALFLGLGLLLGVVRGGRGIEMTARRLIHILVSAVAVSAATIIGFYLFGD